MRTTAFEEYPHETALRLKKEAASDLYDAVAAFVSRWDHGDRADTDYVAELMKTALAKARGEA